MIKSNFKKLDKSKHMFKWFSNTPYQDILESVERMYIKQIPSTKLTSFEVISKPQWLTGGKKTDDPDKVILVRTGFAFSCKFTLKDNNGTHNLQGVFTWVATNLDQKETKQKKWMDLNGTLEEFGYDGLLKGRIYIKE